VRSRSHGSLFSVRLGRNDRRDVARLEPLDVRVGVVALVGNHGFGREVFEQRLGLRYIVNLTRRERERDWIAERIDGRVDFRRQSATRAADRLILAVFFWAPALC
jgi:hypothetical protein